MLTRLSISRRTFWMLLSADAVPKKEHVNYSKDLYCELSKITKAKRGVDQERYREVIKKGADFLQASKNKTFQIKALSLSQLNNEVTKSYKNLENPTPAVQSIFTHYGNSLLFLVNLPAFRKILRKQLNFETRLNFYGHLSRHLQVFGRNMRPLSLSNKRAISSFYRYIVSEAERVATSTDENARPKRIKIVELCSNLQRVEKLQLACNFSLQGKCLFSSIARILKEDYDIAYSLVPQQVNSILSFYDQAQRRGEHGEVLKDLADTFIVKSVLANLKDLRTFIHHISRLQRQTDEALVQNEFYKEWLAHRILDVLKSAWINDQLDDEMSIMNVAPLLADLCELRIVPINFFLQLIDFLCEDEGIGPRYEKLEMKHLAVIYEGFLKIGLGSYLTELLDIDIFSNYAFSKARAEYIEFMSCVEKWKFRNDKGNKLVFNNLFNCAQHQAIEAQPSYDPKVINLFLKGITHLADKLGDIEELSEVKKGRLNQTQIAFIQDYKQLVQFYYMMDDFREVKKRLDQINNEFGDPIGTGLQSVMHLQGIQNAKKKHDEKKAENFEQRVVTFIQRIFEEPEFKELHPNLKLVTDVPTVSTYEISFVVCEKDALTDLKDADHEDYFLKKKHTAFVVVGSADCYHLRTPHPLGEAHLRDKILENIGLTKKVFMYNLFEDEGGILDEEALRKEFLDVIFNCD